MRAAKLAIAAALRTDAAVAELVPAGQIFATERATLPTLPAVEIIALSSERVDSGPLIRHELSVEVTVTHPTEDVADELLNRIVVAIRRRLLDAETSERPIVLETREVVLVELKGSRWSLSANGGAAGVIRGASIAVNVGIAE